MENISSIQSYKISSMAEADEYLSELLSQERYRSLDEIERRAAVYIVDRDIAEYFLNKGRELLSERTAI
ncbi:hypothetical protein [Rhizobium oryziradicis]|uniref:Uncharacterized protein n=1 Tax=Rhizobium oryziradicis TaxID=1867956 RepID=A0A1Q8ZLH2_9HYPH|nr:hypothetical protein [Rhizobium oryziradicis]OLP42746.1 hypothetical protein BJF95_01060 [Rhizobium oryziradicis]